MSKKINNTGTVFCKEAYAEDLYNLYLQYDNINKDVKRGEILQITKFVPKNSSEVTAHTVSGLSFTINLKKEKTFLKLMQTDEASFIEWITEVDTTEYLKENAHHLYVEDEEEFKGSLLKAHKETFAKTLKSQINNPTSAYVAKITSKNQGGFFAEIHGVKCFMPGSLAAANKIVNFGEYVGKELNVMIEDYLEPSDLFIISYKKYVDYILPSRLESLEKNKQMTGIVTGSSKHGVFIEFEELFTGLLHTSEMSEANLTKYNTRGFRPGDSITAWLKEIKDNKLILSDNDPNIKIEANKVIKNLIEDKTFEGIVTAVKDFGAFIEFAEYTGLLTLKEIKKENATVEVGNTVSIHVKRVEEETGKIYLSIKK